MILPLFSGIFIKLYDDMHDNNIEISSDQKELLKVLIVCVCTLWFMSDLTLTIIAIFGTIVCYFVNQVDNEFWRACMVIPLVTLFINYNEIPQFIGNTFLMKYTAFVFTVLAIGTYLENKFIPEEFSITKLLIRIIAIILATIGLNISPLFGFPRNLTDPHMYWNLGYTVTSVLGNLYKIHDPTVLNKVLNIVHNK
jgi:hypothetical protein